MSGNAGSRSRRPGPPQPSRRRGLVLIVTAVLAAVLVIALTLGRNGGVQRPGQSTTATRSVPAAAAVPLPRDLPAGVGALSSDDRLAVSRAARAFATDFLAFQRNAKPARSIRFATPEVIALIAALPRGRGTPAVNEHPARLAGVALRGEANPSTVVATATITRLGARYPLRFTLSKTRGTWLVSAVDLD